MLETLCVDLLENVVLDAVVLDVAQDAVGVGSVLVVVVVCVVVSGVDTAGYKMPSYGGGDPCLAHLDPNLAHLAGGWSLLVVADVVGSLLAGDVDACPP